MKRTAAFLIVLSCPFAGAGVARSTVPDARVVEGRTALGVAALPGVGFSLERGGGNKIGFGGGVSIYADREYYRYDRWGRQHFDPDDYLFDFFLIYQFLEGTGKVSDRGFRPHAGVILGLWGDEAGLGPELGVGLALPLEENLTGRVNLVFGPSSGLEFGYRFNPSLEGTITAFSGRGIVGLRFVF
jgi:hypothetical protein